MSKSASERHPEAERSPEGQSKLLSSLKKMFDALRQKISSLLTKKKEPQVNRIPIESEIPAFWAEETTAEQTGNDEERYRLNVEGCLPMYVRLVYDGRSVRAYVSIPKMKMEELQLSSWEELMRVICGNIFVASGMELTPELHYRAFISPLLTTIAERRSYGYWPSRN